MCPRLFGFVFEEGTGETAAWNPREIRFRIETGLLEEWRQAIFYIFVSELVVVDLSTVFDNAGFVEQKGSCYLRYAFLFFFLFTIGQNKLLNHFRY